MQIWDGEPGGDGGMLTEKQGCAKHTGTKIVILRAFRNKLLLVHYLNTAPCLGKVERIREKSKKKRIKKKKEVFFWKYSFCHILYEAAMHLMGMIESECEHSHRGHRAVHTALHI